MILVMIYGRASVGMRVSSVDGGQGEVPRPLWSMCQRKGTEHTVIHTAAPSLQESGLPRSFSSRACGSAYSSIPSKQLVNLRKVHQAFCLALEKDNF